MSDRDPVVAWRRYKSGSGPKHKLTVDIARAIHEDRHPCNSWDQDVVLDEWLAVGSWQAAEAVVAILPWPIYWRSRRKAS